MTGIKLWISLPIFVLMLSWTSVSAMYNIREPPVGGTLPNGGKIWALLVAGSNGYYNYRHQADVCHAYQILHKNGIPDENIIVMMYDDIATSPENPTPNVIINRPGGPNVYKGVPIDYTGDDVNSTNFLAVLMGQKDKVENVGSGRVLNSGPNDHIFINFVDHGAPGFLCFPNDVLHANYLESAFKTMALKKRFSKMVLYVEACESGSMFQDILPDNMNVFVMTAADPRESSFACYYDKLRGTYLGDVFSVKWMEDSDVKNLNKETLHHQFELVRSETNTSHVEEYGDLDIGSLPVSYFQGQSSILAGNLSEEEYEFSPIEDAVPSREVPLEILKIQYKTTHDKRQRNEAHFKLHRIQKLRSHLDYAVTDIVSLIAEGNDDKILYLLDSEHKFSRSNMICYENVVEYFSSKCFKISENPYALSKMQIFLNVCSAPWASVERARMAMDLVCVRERRLTNIV